MQEARSRTAKLLKFLKVSGSTFQADLERRWTKLLTIWRSISAKDFDEEGARFSPSMFPALPDDFHLPVIEESFPL